MKSTPKLPRKGSQDRQPWYNRIVAGDAREELKAVPPNKTDLSFWSPPYFVGKSYEMDLSLEDWKALMRDVIALHMRVLKPGGFMVVNIGDILCFADSEMPRIQADSISQKKVQMTKNDILRAKKANPTANRYKLAQILGCSEQTIQRRLEDNNVRGGKSSMGTKILLTSSMITKWAESSGLYLGSYA